VAENNVELRLVNGAVDIVTGLCVISLKFFYHHTYKGAGGKQHVSKLKPEVEVRRQRVLF